MKPLIFLFVVASVLTGCVLLPSKFNLGAGVDERFHGTGYNAGFSWDLQKRRVTEDYVTAANGLFGGDAP